VETYDQQSAMQLEKKIRKAKFDLEDFLVQLNQVKKMGPLGQLLEMVPGFPEMPAKMFDGSEEKQFKRIEAIILSMTLEERHNPDILNGNRRRRIAQGSGTTPRDVNQMLNQFNQLQKLTKTMALGKVPNSIKGMFK
jgi:signal recognition particle subunit SRP54